jgi:hypothetical protein
MEDAEENVDTAKTKVAELRKTLAKSPKTNEEGDLLIWVGVLRAINEQASKVFKPVENKIGEMEGGYVTRLSVYRQSVVRILQDSWGLTANDDYEENEILAHLDRVVAHVMLHLTPEQGQGQAPEPLLGGFVMNSAWAALNNIKEGIKEVSASFERGARLTCERERRSVAGSTPSSTTTRTCIQRRTPWTTGRQRC